MHGWLVALNGILYTFFDDTTSACYCGFVQGLTMLTLKKGLHVKLPGIPCQLCRTALRGRGNPRYSNTSMQGCGIKPQPQKKVSRSLKTIEKHQKLSKRIVRAQPGFEPGACHNLGWYPKRQSSRIELVFTL